MKGRMKGRMKRVFSLVLTLVMLASMVAVPAVAESSADIQLGFANGEWADGVYTVDVVASASEKESFDLYSAEIHVSFDKSVLQLVGSTKGEIEDVTYGMEEPESANDRGSFALIIADATKTNHTLTSGETVFVTLQFAEVKDVESCNTELSFACGEGEHNVLGYYDNGNKNYSLNDDAVLAVAVKGNDPVLNEVSLGKGEVTVDGEQTVTVQASAFSAKGTNVSDKVEWSVDAPEAVSANDVIVDENGKITVAAKAAAGQYTVTATPKGEGLCIGVAKAAKLTVERAEPVAKSIVMMKDGEILAAETDTVKVPVSGADDNVYSYSVVMKDQYGDDFTGEVEWTFEVVSGTGKVSFDKETGKLTVSADVSADASFKLTAACGDATAVINISTLADVYLDFANGEWADGVYTVDVVASASEKESFDLYSAEIHVSFDKSVLQLVGSTKGEIEDVTYGMEEPESANDRGSFVLIIADEAKTNHTVVNGVTKLVTLQFAEAYGVEGCDTELSFACGEGEHNVLGYYDNGNKNYSLNDKKTISVAVKGTDPVLGEVSLEESEVAVNGDKTVTVQASAFSLKGTNVTNRVIWSVEPAGEGVSIDAETGNITVSAKAAALEYIVTATPKGVDFCIGDAKTATLTVKDFAPPVIDDGKGDGEGEGSGYDNVTGATITNAAPTEDGKVSFELEFTVEPAQTGLTYMVWVIGEDSSEPVFAAEDGTYTVEQNTTLQVYILGDSDGSGEVDTADASQALKSIADALAGVKEIGALEKAISNYNPENDFDTGDVSAVLKFIADSLAGNI